jgi:hypothetical protein
MQNRLAGHEQKVFAAPEIHIEESRMLQNPVVRIYTTGFLFAYSLLSWQ